MKRVPDYQISIPTEEAFSQTMADISGQLALYRQEGTFSGFDGRPLYYEYFLAQQSRGAVVILHGLSEFTGKYHEFTWYLLNQGYDVFLYDQRCHGRSCRLVDRQDMIHVNRFTDYQKDLQLFLQNIVNKQTQGPLYLYAHSMGGAVAIQYLADHPGVFQKAILSAPMIEPLTGSVKPWIARTGLSACLLFGVGKKKFFLSDEFDPEYPFSRSKDRSQARFRRNMELRLANTCYQTTPLTMRWVQQSMLLRRRLLNKSFVKKLQTPILMICAEQDGVVNEQAQIDFAEKCPVCQRVVMAEATHSMLCGIRETVRDHVQLVLDYFC